MEEKNNSRREFLATGLLAGLAVGCSTKHNPFAPGEEVALTGEMVKLLSVDGEVIEVDKAFLKPVPEMPKFQMMRLEKESMGKNL